ncbi:MAG: 4Fe-4S binding protein [Candidatus Sumerlaea chitinivorans]|nr:4Fe-4S binding protein [Candidatus Sumerlaea chitinivorans]
MTTVSTKNSQKTQKWFRGPSLIQLRRLSQLAFFIFFLYLIVRGRGEPALPEGWRISGAVNPEVLFLANPLTWLLTVIASRTLILKPIWLMVGFVAVTLVFGRVFCGWVCPLGTCLDAAGAVLRPRRLELAAARRQANGAKEPPGGSLFSHRTKYYLLLFLALLAVVGVNLVGWMDPLAILMRATTYAFAPAAQFGAASVVSAAEAFPGVHSVAAGARAWLQANIFVTTQPNFAQAWLHLGIFVGILALARWRRRWWCQYICPLGAFYGLLGRLAPWRRYLATSACSECGVCGNLCRMDAVEAKSPQDVDFSECIRCMECTEVCPRHGIAFGWRAPEPTPHPAPRPLDLTRRGILVSLGSAALVAPLVRLSSSIPTTGGAPIADRTDTYLLRPPGARPEADFLQMCIRCGECFRICPRNALHPTLAEAGLEGLWTPRLVPRLGYCELSCTLCTQVCPTTALEPLTAKRKRSEVKIGTALVDRTRCIAWAENLDCGVCEEVCPVAPKAIVLRGGGRGRGAGERVAAPEVIADRCVGCGLCENKCPTEGAAAIRVTRRGESRHQLP